MDVWREKVQQDINSLKINQTQDRNTLDDLHKDVAAIKLCQTQDHKDIQDLQLNDKLQDREIETIKSILGDIKEDTNWIKRKIMGAIITALITALISGVVGVAVMSIYG